MHKTVVKPKTILVRCCSNDYHFNFKIGFATFQLWKKYRLIISQCQCQWILFLPIKVYTHHFALYYPMLYEPNFLDVKHFKLQYFDSNFTFFLSKDANTTAVLKKKKKMWRRISVLEIQRLAVMLKIYIGFRAKQYFSPVFFTCVILLIRHVCWEVRKLGNLKDVLKEEKRAKLRKDDSEEEPSEKCFEEKNKTTEKKKKRVINGW